MLLGMFVWMQNIKRSKLIYITIHDQITSLFALVLGEILQNLVFFLQKLVFHLITQNVIQGLEE